jgi:hypothetical protein
VGLDGLAGGAVGIITFYEGADVKARIRELQKKYFPAN